MEDHATDIMKAKKNSSMAEGLRRLAAGEGDAFVSAGNSGALVTGATMIVKRIKGIRRVAFAPVLPKGKGCFLLIDSGANQRLPARNAAAVRRDGQRLYGTGDADSKSAGRSCECRDRVWQGKCLDAGDISASARFRAEFCRKY